MLMEALKKNHMSVYKCSKLSDVPYTTLLEIVKNKSTLENCSIKTLYKIANVLGISLDDIAKEIFRYRIPFEEFRSEMCHDLKRMGDKKFIKNILLNDTINIYYNKKWYAEALYLLAMIDFLSKENNIPLIKDYEKYRHIKLKNVLYPRDILLVNKLNEDKLFLKTIYKKSIKEFKDHNIVEVDIRNVV